MSGGLMQLVAYGAQDVYLTGNPQITFFKVAYRRHTNFAMQAMTVVASGASGFDKVMNFTIPRNGDLIMEESTSGNTIFISKYIFGKDSYFY